VNRALSQFFRTPADWQLAFLLIMLTAGYLSIAVSQIALGLGLLVMLYRWVFRKEAPPVTGLEKTALLLAGWALLMIPFSTDSAQSLVYYRRFYLFTAIWVAASVAVTERRRLMMMAALLIGSMSISIYGQIHNARLAEGMFSERMGEIFNPMTSGALLMMALLVAAGFLITGGIRGKIKIAVAVAALPVALGLVLTMTRSAQLGLMAGLGLMLLLAKPRLFGVFLGLLVVAVVFLAFFGEEVLSDRMWGRINPAYVMGGENTNSRLEMWRGGLEMVKAHPITGVGDRGLEEIGPDYYTSEFGVYHGHLHNNLIHMMVIWGIPGLIFGLAFILAGFWYLWKRWRTLHRLAEAKEKAPVQSAWILGALGAWVSFNIAGLTEWYFGDAETMLIFLAILGVALGPGLEQGRENLD
jgi:O-antigen ligase